MTGWGGDEWQVYPNEAEARRQAEANLLHQAHRARGANLFLRDLAVLVAALTVGYVLAFVVLSP